mmetsp:Transcript_21960/g.19974  ORF Transcript_21960/g.19974 Transcript_21960/m.19974 type:complete len:147 (+) Transcript_21960:65-505(+)
MMLSMISIYIFAILLILNSSLSYRIKQSNNLVFQNINRQISSNNVCIHRFYNVLVLNSSKASPDGKEKGPKKKVLKDDVIQVNGKVVESLPNAMFRVEIEPSKQVILATISGKIRKNFVRILVGDSVTCEVSAYDLTRGRITYRNK